MRSVTAPRLRSSAGARPARCMRLAATQRLLAGDLPELFTDSKMEWTRLGSEEAKIKVLHSTSAIT